MPSSPQRLLLGLLAPLIGCADVQHRLPLDLEEGALAIVAVVDGEQLETTAIVGGSAARLDFPPDSTAIVWRHPPGAFIDPNGRALDPKELLALTVSTEGPSGCGRCLVPADRIPQLVSPGDDCRLPLFASATAYVNDGGPAEVRNDELIATTAKRIRLQWPGTCSCPETPPADPGPADLVAISSAAPIATDAGTLMSDGTLIGVSPGAFISVDPSGSVTTRRLIDPRGGIRSRYTLDEGLLLVTEEPLAQDGGSIYELVTPNLDIVPVSGLPAELDVQIIRRGPQGALFFAGRSLRFAVPTHVAFRCTPQSATAYTCVEEAMTVGDCDSQDFDLLSSFSSSTGVMLAFGSLGRVYVRPAQANRWACQQDLTLGNFVRRGELFSHLSFTGWAFAADDRIYLCTVGVDPTGLGASAVRSIGMPAANTLDDLPVPLFVETVVSVGQLCTDLSTTSDGRRVRTLWGLGDRAIDIVDGRVINEFIGVGQRWTGGIPELLPEANDPILDWAERDGWALAVGAARWLYRRTPGEAEFTPVYAGETRVRGPTRAMAATEPNTIVTFGSTPTRVTKTGDLIESTPLPIEGYPSSPTAQADFAIADAANPSRILVATHDAVRTRCRERGVTMTPCWRPSTGRSFGVLDIDLDEGRVIDIYRPFADDPALIVAGASLGAGAFVFIDAEARLVSLIDGVVRSLPLIWDDPTTSAVEPPAEVGRWYDVAGRDGVAWITGAGRLGRVVWTADRRLVVEAYWHHRLGSPLTPADERESAPIRIDARCADRAMIQTVQTSPARASATTSIRSWSLGAGTDGCSPNASLALCALPSNDGQQAFSRSFDLIRPMGTLLSSDGGARVLYNDGTIETRGHRRVLTPFSYVAGYAVSGDLVLVGGEGERIVAVVPQ